MAESQSIVAGAADPAPRLVLAGKDLKATVCLPDAEKGYYCGSRFDWSGLVVRVEWGGHTFFGPWKKKHNPVNHDDLAGTAEEFGMFSPLGYTEAKPGETFVKIGVGELEKPREQEYLFHRNYKVAKPGAWRIRQGADWVEFAQELRGPRGIGYRYVKRVAVAAQGASLHITRELVNTGSVAIDTDHYCHNFTVVDDQPVVGPQYAVEFPFTLKPAEIGEPVKDPAEIVKLEGRRLALGGELPAGKSFHVTLAGYQGAGDHRFRLVNPKAGVAMTVTGDRPMSKLCVWAMNPVICPEPFVAVKIEPGEEMKWETRYEFGGAR